ncbi:unnamed protein product [Ceutorhynchus assimilis]|uniref:Apoptosis inhibitor 5 n=1 Tax=Ceutorhynchus assimilis TaxID=467358 RepID=A0A9N9QHQ8_9CUCU|nr:unnamed protein product [Ceutorhynchus assimilis]
MATPFQKMYEKYDILSEAREHISEKSSEYQDCIQGTKGGPKEKKLAAQIIAKFFKHFPHLHDQALNSILDLCEDCDSEIRICAIKVLPTLCKENKELVINIASILAQLLQLDVPDYNVACNSLVQVFKIDPLNAIKGIFNNLHAMDEESLREKIVEFLYTKLIKLLESNETQEINDILLKEAKKMIQDCSSEEFMILITYLLGTKWAKLEGQQEIINLIAEKIEINDILSLNDIDRLILCVDLVIPLFNFNNDSSKFVTYYCQEVLPKLDEIVTLQNGEQLQIKLLRQLALMSSHCNHITQETLNSLFQCLKQFIPLPPEDVDLSKSPDLKFCHVECLLYSFHKLGKSLPEFLLNDQEKLTEFRARLQYFSRGVSGCKRGLKIATNEKLSQAVLDKVNLTPQVLDNLLVIIKDLFHQTPLYKANVKLSFTMIESTTAKIEKKSTSSSAKRPSHTPITFDSANGNSKQPRGEDRKLYQPPSGKFSSGFGGRSRAGGSWSRGGQRPKGRNTSWRN